MPHVLLVAGSPSATSRSTRVLRALGERVAARGATLELTSIDDFDARDLLYGKSSPATLAFLGRVRDASAVVFGTPVYKATYAGALKLLIDLIERSGLEGKQTLGVATARLEAHRATVSRSFAELWSFFEGTIPLPSIALLDSQLGTSESLELNPAAVGLLDDAAQCLAGRGSGR